MDWNELQTATQRAVMLMGKHGVYSSGAHFTLMISTMWNTLTPEKQQEYRKTFKAWGTEYLLDEELDK